MSIVLLIGKRELTHNLIPLCYFTVIPLALPFLVFWFIILAYIVAEVREGNK